MEEVLGLGPLPKNEGSLSEHQEGVLEVLKALGFSPLSEYEKNGLKSLKPELKASIDNGINFKINFFLKPSHIIFRIFGSKN